MKSGMSGEGGEDMGRVTGEKHKLIHYQQVRMRSKVENEDEEGRKQNPSGEDQMNFIRNTTGTVAFPVSSWSSPTGTGEFQCNKIE